MTSRQTSIFVSSAYQELITCRQAAIDAVWRCEYFPTGMERGNYAMPYSTSESSRKMVDEAVVYVGVFSHRYGVVTTEELRRAQKRGIPILPFIATEPLNDKDTEPDREHARLLEELKRELLDTYVVGMFSTPEELGSKVYRSLVALRDEGKLPQPDATTGQEPEVIPSPPAPYYAHPYLLGGSGFVGRRTELAQLDAWAHASEPVLIVEAIGGAGKSALTWNWAQTHLDAALPNRAGVIWWSFYESNATMGTFLTRTLAYLTQRPEAECARLSRPQQEEQVLALLAQQPERPVIIVMDGLERLLVAYHRMDAARLSDAAVEAGKEAQPRACTDPRDGAFLRALTHCPASRVIISSRLLPTDLQDRAGQLLQGVRHLPLYGLTAEDAIALMEHIGVHGSHELMRAVLSQFGDHALLVQVLAGRIRAYRPAPGDFERWYQDEGRHIQLDARDLTARRASILDAALADLDPAIFRFLCQMAAFRYPVDYAALVALNPFTEPLRGEAAAPSRPLTTGEEQARYDAEAALARLHRALAELEERGLVQWDRAHNRYDLHPVVRSFAYARLENRTETFARLRSYFEALPAEDGSKVQDVADLHRTLEIYHALVESGLFDQALYLYYARLTSPLIYRLGAYTTMVELLAPLFPRGFAEPPALSRPSAQGFAINGLALALDYLGESAQTQGLFGVYIHLTLQARDAENLANGLSNLGVSLLNEGRYLAAAERALIVERDLAMANADQSRWEIAQRNLMSLYARTGTWEAGEAAYAALLVSRGDVMRGHFVPIHAARLRFGQGENAAGLLDVALAQARSNRFPRAEREARRLQGEVALAQGDLALAEEAWQAALAIAQQQSVPLGPYLADLARLRARQGNATLARELIAEAVTLGGLGVALAATEVYLAVGETAAAKRYAVPAYMEAWADGPPYAQALELERARAALTVLEMPEPQLPPFDPAKVAPVPYEAEIRAFIEELRKE